MATKFAIKSSIIIESSSVIRSQMLKLLSDLGFKRENIVVVKSLTEARDFLCAKNFDLVLADLGTLSAEASEILEELLVKKFRPNCIHLFLVARENQQLLNKSFHRKEEIFLSSPFVYKEVFDSLREVLSQEVLPEPVGSVLPKYSDLLASGNYTELCSLLEKKLQLGDASYEDHYFFGKALEAKGDREKASEVMEACLEKFGQDYRSLNSIYELYVKQRDYSLARETLLGLRNIMPLTESRLGELLILSTFESKSESILEYISDLENFDLLSEKLKEIVTTSCLLAAKNLSNENKTSQSRELFLKLTAFTSFDWTILKNIVEFLGDNSLWSMAEEFLAKTKEEDRQNFDYIGLDFLVGAKIVGDNYVLNRYRELNREGKVQHFLIYEELIRVQVKRKNMLGLEQAFIDAKKHLPHHIEKWKQLEKEYENIVAA